MTNNKTIYIVIEINNTKGVEAKKVLRAFDNKNDADNYASTYNRIDIPLWGIKKIVEPITLYTDISKVEAKARKYFKEHKDFI